MLEISTAHTGMKRLRFSWPKLIAWATAALLLAAWVVPKISAERFREPIHAALERALGRKVDFSRIRFRLLPLPGFILTYVIVGEDPHIGAEPIAYVDTVRAVPRISSLFTGALALSSVDLDGATITLTRIDRVNSDVRWNFSSVMRPSHMAAFPSVHMRSGRINFKFGDTKSIFYLFDTDVDLWPPSGSGGAWIIHVHAQPARTDRPARAGAFGYFSARGDWRPRENSVTLNVKLEQSELGDMLTLFEGHESGILGEIRGDAHLAGPIDRVGIRGRLTVQDIHGWNEKPPGGNEWPVWLSGYVDARGQVIDVRAMLAQSRAPLDVRYRVADYLGRPQWGVTAIFSNFPVSPLVSLARNLGARIPADLSLGGVAEGAASYAMPNGTPRLDGEIAISDLTIGLGSTPKLRADPVAIRLAGSSLAFGPAALHNAANETATLSAGYDLESQAISASITTEGMSIASLRQQISAAGLPLLGQATAGNWSGRIEYASGWRGDFRLTDADIPFEAFSKPIHLLAADASIDGEAINIRKADLTAGGIEATGDYRYEPGATRPHRFRMSIVRTTGAALEDLFSPTLRRGGFLNYAFNFGRPQQPGWLTQMHADGTVQVGALSLAGADFTRLRARVLWDGYQIRLADAQTAIAGGRFAGIAGADVAGREPRYRIAGSVTNVPWRSGAIDVEGEMGTYGFGNDVLAHMRASGSIRGRDVELSPVDTWDSINGCFEWAWAPRNPSLRLTQLVMTADGQTWLGSAETQNNGELVLRITDGARRLEASGALFSGDPLRSVTQ